MAKRLSDEEKQQRAWEQEPNLDYVIKCKCGKIHKPLRKNKSWRCSCGRYIFFNHKPGDKRNCEVLYEREITRSKRNVERSS